MSQKRRVYATATPTATPAAPVITPVSGAGPAAVPLTQNGPASWPQQTAPAASPVSQPQQVPSPIQQPFQQPQGQSVSLSSFSGPNLIPARPYDPIPLPEFLRLTLRSCPSNDALLKKTQVPLGAIIHPLPFQYGVNESVPVVDMGSAGIVRCRRCRGYINPFARFVENGSRWQCNLCGLINETPGDYYSPVDAQGLRQDRLNRPELSQCVVEFVAPSEYMVRPPMTPVYFFVIDVSYAAVAGGVLDIVAQSIQYILNTLLDQQPDSRLRVGFITYDSRCHFYNLRSRAAAPQMLVVGVPEKSDEHIYVPTGQDLLVNLHESKPCIDMLLSTMPDMFKQSKDSQSCLGSSLQAAYRIMEPFGGKLFVFASSAPSLGPAGSIVDTQRLSKNAKVIGTPQESQLLTPNEANGSANWYRNFSLECSKQQICVDLFATPPSTQLIAGAPSPATKSAGAPVHGFLDLATLSLMPEVTGGQVWHYPSFHPGINGQALSADLVASVQRQTAWEAVMRVRCSKGVQVLQHFGHFFIRSTDLLALPACDAHKAFAVQLEIQQDLLEVAPIPGIVTLQAALLYTNQNSERRIRVLTIGIPLSQDLGQIFNSVDVGAVIALTSKMAIQKLQNSTLNDARDAVVNKAIEIITNYQKGFGGSGGSQLVLPESLRALPLYSLALVKSNLIRIASDIPVDSRMAALSLVRTLPTELVISYLYPRLISLHNLPDDVGFLNEQGISLLPPSLNLSAEKLDRTGVFLLISYFPNLSFLLLLLSQDNGVQLLIWVASSASQELIEQMFALPGATAVTLEPYQAAANLTPNPDEPPETLRNRVANVINSIRADRPCYQPLTVLLEKDVRVQSLFYERLIEDRTRNVFSYFEFVQQLQKAVNKNIRG